MARQFRHHWQNLTSAVELLVFLGDDVKSKELNTLVAEIVEMSALVTIVEVDASNERVSSILLKSVKTDG